jgi:hypothetical protein
MMEIQSAFIWTEYTASLSYDPYQYMGASILWNEKPYTKYVKLNDIIYNAHSDCSMFHETDVSKRLQIRRSVFKHYWGEDYTLSHK